MSDENESSGSEAGKRMPEFKARRNALSLTMWPAGRGPRVVLQRNVRDRDTGEWLNNDPRLRFGLFVNQYGNEVQMLDELIQEYKRFVEDNGKK